MRRRLMDVGRLKRLPVRKTKSADPVQSSSLLHMKLFSGWSVIVLLDLLVGFRLEYLYPAFMFLRSVVDSYKYQGLIFSLLFVCLVAYLDILCWTLLVGPWLFLLASSCVWLEYIRTSDHMFGYTSVLLWMLFLYVEVTHRLHSVPPSLVDFSRPFAAHCIGYPVVTVSFLLKHQITQYIRQRQQKLVAEENSACFEILHRALPVAEQPSPEGEEVVRVATDEQEVKGRSGRGTSSGKPSPATSKERSQNSKASCKITSNGTGSGGGGGGGGSSNGGSYGGGGISKPLDNRPPQGRVYDGSSVSSNLPSTAAAVAGDASTRPLSTGKGHAPIGRKQALVKAVPRTDLPSHTEMKDKSKLSVEDLLQELKQERSVRFDAETGTLMLQKEVKKLEADLRASSLQEEEATLRVEQLQQQEKWFKSELQRLKNESDILQNKILKLSSSRQHDEGTISSLEHRLKQESDCRLKVEAELREQRSQASSQSAWTQEEVRELKEQLMGKEKELAKAREEVQCLTSQNKELQKELMECCGALRSTEARCGQLRSSLAGETRVKIELFTALSEARRKQEGMMEELKKKTAEVDSLHQNMSRLVALQSTWTPSLSHHH